MCTKNWNIPFEKPNNGETLFGKIIIVSQHMLKSLKMLFFLISLYVTDFCCLCFEDWFH